MSGGSDIVVRRARSDDAATVLDLINKLAAFVEDPPSSLTPDEIARDGFGPDPWFVAFLAEQDGAPVGLALAYRAYATDLGNRGLYLSELYVEPARRGAGVGRALMQALAQHGKTLGCTWISWDVWRENKGAYAFYESLGAQHRDDVSLMLLDGAAFDRVATLNR